MAKGYISNRQKNLSLGIVSYTENQEVLSVIGKVGVGTRIDITPYDTLSDGTLSFEGSAGQLFSITNNLTSGSIFSVNDVSGIPSIDVDADGTVQLAPFGASEYVGIGTTNPTAKLDVNGTAKATLFVGSGASLTNIPNGALDNSTVSYGGVQLSLGGSDATPAFNLSDATNYPYSSLTGITTNIVGDTTPQLGGDLDVNGNDISGTGNINLTGVITATSFDGSLATTNLTGTITNAQLAGSIDNSKLSNSTVSYGGVQLSLGGSDATPAFNLSDATNYPYSSLTGITTDIVGDTSPQLGGNLDLNSNDITGTGNISITGNLNVSGVSTFQDNVNLGDDDRLRLGDSSDLQIYHSGSHSFITDVGTGNLYIGADQNIILSNPTANEFYALFNNNGSVELYYDNSKKFETTTTGIAITNGASTSATIVGPDEIIIDPATVGDNTGSVRIKGDLFVDGTTTQINSTTIELADFIVGIATTATTDTLADGAGIQIGPDNTFLYEYNSGTNPSLKSSENLNVASGKHYQIGETEVLNATTLGSGVVNSSLTSVGTLTGLTVSGDVSIADKIVHTGDTNTAIRFPANDTFTVETAGSERLRVTSAGDVGIGTDNPTQKLDVNGNARFRGAIYDNNNAVGTANSVLTSTGSGVVWAQAGVQVSVGTEAPTSPSQGELWYNSEIGRTFVYYQDGTSNQWVDSAPFYQNEEEPVLTAGKTSSSFTATEGQTTFTFSYEIGYIEVYLNGVRLSVGEYTATNGTSFTLSTGASEGDVVDVVEYIVGIGATGPGGPIENIAEKTDSATYYPIFTTGVGSTFPYITTTSDYFEFTPSTGTLDVNNLTTGNSIVVGSAVTITSSEIDITGGITASGIITATDFNSGNSIVVGSAVTITSSEIDITGGITASGIITATDFNSTSDIALKTNITQIDNPIDKISQINGVSFDWKETQRPSAGVIAQDVEKVLPQLVNGEDTKTVNYNGLIGVLIEAVKEQQEQINTLKEEIAKLKG